jgi:hypothetical protein
MLVFRIKNQVRLTYPKHLELSANFARGVRKPLTTVPQLRIELSGQLQELREEGADRYQLGRCALYSRTPVLA